VRPEELSEREIPMTTIGNRTRDFPVCRAVRQGTAPPAACAVSQSVETLIEGIKTMSYQLKGVNLQVLK
jgi:hypothetical protein